MQPEKAVRRWQIINDNFSTTLPSATKTPATVPAAILAILANRDISDPEEIKRFLFPSLEQLPPPQSMLGLERAVAILIEARENRTPVLVYGDYDADGVTATALLVKFFREINLPVSYHLPHRLEEGYGLNPTALTIWRNRPGIAEHPAPVLLTVDCGIGNLAEIAAANALGFQVIITDHHQPGRQLPAAAAILNPHLPECPFPYKELAGVGVAFYLAAGLRAELEKRGTWGAAGKPNLKNYLDLVAIGSVADMVPLRETNRVLVKAGLEILNDRPTPGIQALLKQIGLEAGKISAETISFYLAPHLNAAGRIGSAELALQLLLAEEEASAELIAYSLCQANQTRKHLTEEMFAEARRLAEGQVRANNLAIVVTAPGWHQGIIGLVASRLAREYHRPAIAFAVDEQLGVARGSVRSIEGLDIHTCLQACAEVLDKFGGHRLAAGVTLKVANLAEFQSRFLAALATTATPADMTQRLEIDLIAAPNDLIRMGVLNYLQHLEPFGNGNREPIFCCPPEGVTLSEVKKVGADSLRFVITSAGKSVKGIGFGLSSWARVAEREPLRLAYKFCRNYFRGQETWELRAEDIKSPT